MVRALHPGRQLLQPQEVPATLPQELQPQEVPATLPQELQPQEVPATLPQELQPQEVPATLPQELQPQLPVLCPATLPLQQGLQQEFATKSGKMIP